MRDRGILLEPYLDHGVLARMCEEVGVSLEDLDPSGAGPTQVPDQNPRLPKEYKYRVCGFFYIMYRRFSYDAIQLNVLPRSTLASATLKRYIVEQKRAFMLKRD